MTPYLTDVAVHAGVGTMFACTGACARHMCRHKLQQFLLGGALILIEAAATVQVIG